MEAASWYSDWKAWSAIVAWLSFGISVLPWLRKKLLPANANIIPHSMFSLSHRMGLTNIQWVVRVENSGGSDLDIAAMDVVVTSFDGSLKIPVWTYYIKSQAEISVLAGLKLKSGESWQAALCAFERMSVDEMREYRGIQNAVRKDLKSKAFGTSAEIDSALHERSMAFFNKHFKMKASSYDLVLICRTRDGKEFRSKKCQFVLFESDVAEQIGHSDRYSTGDGISWWSEHDLWLQIPFSGAE